MLSLRPQCKRCGHTYPADCMTRVHWEGRSVLFCPQCYLELVEKRTGYRQAKLEFPDEGSGSQDRYPF